MAVLIKGGRVVDPSQDLDQQTDVLIDEGRVVQLGRGLSAPTGAQVVEAKGKWVLPGLVDLNARVGEPGFEYKEDLASGTLAAAAGGFCTLCALPNSMPLNDCRAVTEQLKNRIAQQARVRVLVVALLTEGREGRRLTEYADLKEAGVVALCDDGKSVADSGLMRRALEYAATFGLPVFAHCEDVGLAAGRVMNEGVVATRCGLPGQPPVAEEIVLARDLALVELTGARYHAQHLSTVGAVRLMREAKRRGLPVSCEVAANHLLLTDQVCASYKTNTKVRPPFRTQRDVDALREGLADGTIDAIVSDHCPQSVLEKEVEYGYAAFGASTLETTLSVGIELAQQGGIPLARLVDSLTAAPARVVGQDLGSLRPGASADLLVVDPEAEWTVDAASLHSKCKYTPLDGRPMRGRVELCLAQGQQAYRPGGQA